MKTKQIVSVLIAFTLVISINAGKAYKCFDDDLNVNRLDSGAGIVCKCLNNFKMGSDGYCQIDCKATDPNSQLAPGSKTQCVCHFGFTKGTDGLCHSGCTDPNTKPSQANVNNCICKDGFTGEPNSCVRDCSADPKSHQVNGQCLCVSPNVGEFPKCHEDCSLYPNTYYDLAQDFCLCNCGYVYIDTNNPFLGCKKDCSGDPNSHFDDTTQECVCNAGFTGGFPRCIRQCGLNQRYADGDPYAECICKEGYIPSSVVGECQRDCQKEDEFSILDSEVATKDACVCNLQEGYVGEFGTCHIRCVELSPNFALGCDRNSCGCKAGTILPDCQTDCQAIDQFSELIPNQIVQCQCKVGFVKGTGEFEGLCVRDCAAQQNSNLQFNPLKRDQCVCKEGFYWKRGFNKCVRNCAGVEHSNQIHDPKIYDQCHCHPDFKWNRNDLKCYIDCSVIQFTNLSASALANNKYSCVCNTGYSWYSVPPINKCVKKRLLLSAQPNQILA